MAFLSRVISRSTLIRLFNWEYWSFGAVYACIYPVWLLLSLRARSFFFFSAANPSIRNGGFLGESKKDIHAIMPKDMYPPTIHFSVDESPDSVLVKIKAHDLNYPLVGKPDMGGRGRGVKVLRSDEDVRKYVQHCNVDYHLQQFVDLPSEAGIFYHRYPGASRGAITGIVRKEFLTVTGNGKLSLRELIKLNDRSYLQLQNLEEMYGKRLDEVLPNEMKMVLVPYGNHARGALFVDDSHLADEQLTDIIDKVCRQIPQFHFGRLDIRFNTWEELKAGKNFCVIEVNGAGSEPTHMYDPKHSIFFAWREIVRHWNILCRVSRMNHRLGHKYLTWKEAREMYRTDKKNSELIERMPL
jgi:hypothetical protein